MDEIYQGIPVEQLQATNRENEPEALNLLQTLHAMLGVLYLNYWVSHWQASGDTSYGDHLLFERLYEDIQDQIDGLAEKIVAKYGVEAVELPVLGTIAKTFVYRWNQVPCIYERGILAEKEYLEASKRAYEALKEMDALSLGMDDFIMATASDHEEYLYLLQAKKQKHTH